MLSDVAMEWEGMDMMTPAWHEGTTLEPHCPRPMPAPTTTTPLRLRLPSALIAKGRTSITQGMHRNGGAHQHCAGIGPPSFDKATPGASTRPANTKRARDTRVLRTSSSRKASYRGRPDGGAEQVELMDPGVDVQGKHRTGVVQMVPT